MTSPTAPPPLRAGRREWTALAVLALPTLLVSIDVFVLLLALPHLSADLGASATEQLWITDVYGFVLAGVMLTMGTLGDRIGRRRLLLIGATGFAAASVLAAFSVTPAMLIAARALLGVAGATIAPSALALITNLFRDAAQRAQAIGLWLVCFIGGAAVGPLVGGVMLEVYWWGAAFLLGVPAMLVLLLAAPALLPEYRSPDAGRIDLTSVALSFGAILPTVYGLKELARGEGEVRAALSVLVGLAVGVTFVLRQLRLADPLLDVRMFRDRRFATAVGGMHLITVTGATMFFVTQHLQLAAGLRPLAAAVLMLPGVAASIAGFLLGPRLARHLPPARVIAVGLLAAAGGVLIITRSDGAATAPLVVGYALFQLGCAPMVALGTDLAVGTAPPERAGSAAATSEAASELGYALGIAALGSVAAAVYRGSMAGAVPADVPGSAAQAARESLAGASAVADGMDDAAASRLLDAAREAFLAGMDVALLVIAALLLALGVVVLTMLRGLPPVGRPSAETVPVGVADAGRDVRAPSEPGQGRPWTT